MNVKAGDKLTFVVEDVDLLANGSGSMRLKFKGGVAYNWIDPQTIQHHQVAPDPLKVGDVVKLKVGGIHRRRILAIIDDYAWVVHIGAAGGGVVFLLDELERVILI